ncbi:MAG: hypothetical protein ACNS60_08615 [Candidatus Cyclobacteriaceae bacterium M2_1C_046]
MLSSWLPAKPEMLQYHAIKVLGSIKKIHYFSCSQLQIKMIIQKIKKISITVSIIIIIYLLSFSTYAQNQRHEINIGAGIPSLLHLQYNFIINNHSLGVAWGTDLTGLNAVLFEYRLPLRKGKLYDDFIMFYYSPSMGYLWYNDDVLSLSGEYMLVLSNVIGCKVYFKPSFGINLDAGLGIYSPINSPGCSECDYSYQPFSPSIKGQLFYKF